jgi:hypothetical protein
MRSGTTGTQGTHGTQGTWNELTLVIFLNLREAAAPEKPNER